MIAQTARIIYRETNRFENVGHGTVGGWFLGDAGWLISDGIIGHSDLTAGSIMQDILSNRNSQFARIAKNLPGAVAYDNYRPLNIPGRYDGAVLSEVVLDLFPHVSSNQWEEWFDAGYITKEGCPVSHEYLVRGGEQLMHLFPDTVEPDVNANIRLIWEDSSLIGLIKPAPLPSHPSGRFNRNTLTYLLEQVYGSGVIRLVHRLDANTSGVMLLAKSADVATELRMQFESGQVVKTYIARVIGHPSAQKFVGDSPIGRHRFQAGSRGVSEKGVAALTEFHVLKKLDDGTSLIQAEPKTGRTNQIRIHLWDAGYPILGDPTYLAGHRTDSRQTLDTDDVAMCLHAKSLEFVHPETSEVIRFESDMPQWDLS